MENKTLEKYPVAHFECSDCGTIILIPQPDKNKLRKPSFCECGRKKSFEFVGWLRK